MCHGINGGDLAIPLNLKFVNDYICVRPSPFIQHSESCTNKTSLLSKDESTNFLH